VPVEIEQLMRFQKRGGVHTIDTVPRRLRDELRSLLRGAELDDPVYVEHARRLVAAFGGPALRARVGEVAR
jgi:hypothetical protein